MIDALAGYARPGDRHGYQKQYQILTAPTHLELAFSLPTVANLKKVVLIIAKAGTMRW